MLVQDYDFSSIWHYDQKMHYIAIQLYVKYQQNAMDSCWVIFVKSNFCLTFWPKTQISAFSVSNMSEMHVKPDVKIKILIDSSPVKSNKTKEQRN